MLNRKAGGFMGKLRNAMESHFDSKFTWGALRLVGLWESSDMHWKAILIVNLRGVRKSGVIFKSIRQALESHFDCEFTWCAQVWGDFQEN